MQKKRRKTNKNIEKHMKTWKNAERQGKMKKCTKKYPSGGTLGGAVGTFWSLLGALGTLLGALGALLSTLGRLLGASWTPPGRYLEKAWVH